MLRIMKVFTQEGIKITYLVVLLTNLFVLMINLLSQFLFSEVKILILNLLKQFLKIMSTVKRQLQNNLNKNLIMNKKKQFQSSNTGCICEKRIDNDDEKVRDHCHITGKFRGAGHWSCNINLQLANKVPVIFQN